MSDFCGFLNNERLAALIPDEYITDVVPHLDDLDTLKVTLYALWFIAKSGGDTNPIRLKDFFRDEQFPMAFGKTEKEQKENIRSALQKALEQHILIGKGTANIDTAIFYINSTNGRKALKNAGATREIKREKKTDEKINIFALYEENFGILTPMIAEALRQAEGLYPAEWIQEAMKIAVSNNVRRWRYVEAILQSWKEEGRHGTDKRAAEEDYKRYLKGKYGEYIEQ